MNNSTGNVRATRWFGRTLILATSIMTMLLLTACGSTKVYNNDKTIVYRDTIYNVSTVKQIRSKTTGKLSDDSVVNLKGANKKKVQGLIKENGSVYVRMSFDLDEQEMLYRAKSVDNWSDYSRMQKDFEKAGKQITSLVGDKKKMQLKLR
jgi:hypothetical protein